MVSEINDRLSPKKEPPTTTATIKGRAISVFSASPTATGVRATIVPTLVPMDREMKQAAINIPASNRLSGRICSVRLTVASMAPICLALCAKAPARMNIHIINGDGVAGRNEESNRDRYFVEVVAKDRSHEIKA